MSTHSSTRATTHHLLTTCHLRLLGPDWGSDLSPCREKKVSHFQEGQTMLNKDTEQKVSDSTRVIREEAEP